MIQKADSFLVRIYLLMILQFNYQYCIQIYTISISNYTRISGHQFIITRFIMDNQQVDQNMIEMVSRSGTANIKEVKEYRNQKDLQYLPNQLIFNVCRILNHRLGINFAGGRKWKVYSLFYIDPMDGKTGAWDFFIIFAIYLFQIQISLTLGFGPTFWQDQLNNNFYTATYLLIIVMFIVDIIINFHKGYYAFGRGKVIDEPQLIIKHYLKIYFAMDIVTISTLIIPLVKNDYVLNYIQLLPAVLLYLKKFNMLQYRRKFRTFFILFMLACDVMLIGHFGACIFVGLDLLLWRTQYYGNDPRYYWLSRNTMYSVDLINGPWILQYIYAQSFSTGTLSTIAPGPFGMNPIQIMYSNFVMIFFMLLASYAAEVLVSILLSEDQIRTFHEDNIQKFDSFMKLKGVREAISSKIQNFFQLVWETQIKMNIEQEKAVLQKLPETLRDQLIIEMQFVKNLKFISSFENSQLLIRVLSLKVSKVLLDSDRNLFLAGQIPLTIDQRYLFYFKQGLAKMYLSTTNKQYILSLSNFQRLVGQYQFITGLAYSYSCRSLELCIVSRIAHVDFMEVIRNNDMIEQLQSIKYELLIENQLFLIGKRCLICQERHVEGKCSEINPSLRIQENYKNELDRTMKRKTYRRRELRQTKTRKINESVMIQGHIVMLFMVFQKTTKRVNVQIDSIDEVKEYEKYFPSYNLNANAELK